MNYKWIKRYLQMARFVSDWSKDPSTQVGAVIVTPTNQPVSFGFNGFPRGMSDNADRYEDKAFKHRHVIHAETNAILNAKRSVDSCLLFVTHPPCQHCAGSIVQAGIKEVYSIHPNDAFMKRWSMDDTIQVFKECGVFFETYLLEGVNQNTPLISVGESDG